MNNVFACISEHYYKLTAAEKKVADLVMSEELKTQYMSISELAKASEVAEATVSRFTRQLGYKGFYAFKLAIANSKNSYNDYATLSNDITATDDFEIMCQKLLKSDMDALMQTKQVIQGEQIAKACKILLHARQVLCMGQGGSMIMAQEAAHLFSTVRSGYFAIADSHMQTITATHLTSDDVVLYFSYSGGTRDLIDLLKLVQKHQATSILVTRYPNSPAANLASVVLQCGSNENPLQLGSITARIAQLYLIEVLFTEMCRHNEPTYRQIRKNIADALAEKHV